LCVSGTKCFGISPVENASKVRNIANVWILCYVRPQIS
jgi:hypothetical protein